MGENKMPERSNMDPSNPSDHEKPSQDPETIRLSKELTVSAHEKARPGMPKEQRRVTEEEEESGRERLKRHRREIAGRVWIPESWGKESLLKDWTGLPHLGLDLERSLAPEGILSARDALVDEFRRRAKSVLGTQKPVVAAES